MKGYKAFDKGMKCRGYQFKENEVFEEKRAEICKSGFHFCKNPLDTLDYYDLIDNDGNIIEIAEVKPLDKELTDDNKKYCTKKIKIGAKLDFKGFVKASFNFIWEKTKDNVISENCSQLASSGDYSQLASSGDCSQLASSGDYSQLASSGYNSQLASSGYNSQLASSGCNPKLASSGDYSQLASSGDCSKLASSGDYSQLASSGDCSQLASSGDCSQLASSGDCSQLASSGDYSQLASSGDCSQLSMNGKNSVGANVGRNGKIKGKKRNWITLAEYNFDKKMGCYICVCVKSAQIDGKTLKEDTWYILKNGEFVEVE